MGSLAEQGGERKEQQTWRENSKNYLVRITEGKETEKKND